VQLWRWGLSLGYAQHTCSFGSVFCSYLVHFLSNYGESLRFGTRRRSPMGRHRHERSRWCVPDVKVASTISNLATSSLSVSTQISVFFYLRNKTNFCLDARILSQLARFVIVACRPTQPSFKHHRIEQLPFRKTGTMGTLVTKAEIGVWVQVPLALAVLEVGAGDGFPLPQRGPGVSVFASLYPM